MIIWIEISTILGLGELNNVVIESFLSYMKVLFKQME